MRQIGHLDTESAARTFSDFLYVQGIENQIELETSQGWAIWIRTEDEIARAKELLASYCANPNDPKFRSQAKSAAKLRAEEEKGQAAYLKKIMDRPDWFRSMANYGFGPLTAVLICISVGVFMLSKLGSDTVQTVPWLFISEYRAGLPEVRSGELWRLVTPIFIHFGFLHVFFNMLWLRDLGSMIEGRQSSLQLAVLVFVIAAVSNLAQYFAEGPSFGGMSGVVYGLAGYIWIRGKYDPGSGLFLHPSTVAMMIVWFLLCLSGLVGYTANWVHAVGLGLGMAWGYLSSAKYR